MTAKLRANVRSTADRFLKVAMGDDEARRKWVVAEGYRRKQDLASVLRRGRRREPAMLPTIDDVLRTRFRTPREVYRGNTFYGIGLSLREYANFAGPVYGCIEHGLYFGSYVNPYETSNSGLPALVTMSDRRRAHVENVASIPVISVGPYIAYARLGFQQDWDSKVRGRYGRILLAFPSHGIDRLEMLYDTGAFIDHLKSLKQDLGLDSVVVCLYYRDAMRGAHRAYEEAGFLTTTAGRREDPWFLSRLRWLIESSEVTASNSVGTHVGYCTYLQRPHVVFEQKLHAVAHSETELATHVSTATVTAEQEKREVAEVFRSTTTAVTAEQRAICDKYWGFSLVRPPEEIHSILTSMASAHLSGVPISETASWNLLQ